MLFRGFRWEDDKVEVFRDAHVMKDFTTDNGKTVPFDGVDWPGPNHGSLCLAFALLFTCLPDQIAVAFAERFAADVITKWTGDQWACTSEGIQEWAGQQDPQDVTRPVFGDVLFHLHAYGRLLLPGSDK